MRGALLLFMSLALVSCGAFYGTGPRALTLQDVVGSYALVTYDGKPLPYAIDDTISVKTDTLILNSDGEYDEIIAYANEKNDITVFRYRGNFSFNGNWILVNFNTGGGFVLEIPERGTLTEHDGNGTIVYQKPF